MDWCNPSYASLSFHKDDLIRFLNFPSSITRGAEPVIASAWGPGIQKESPAPSSHTFKLRGKPWGSTADASSVASRRLVRDILAHLHAHGWLIVTSLGHSIRIGSKDTLIFRHTPPPQPSPPTTSSSPLPPSPSPITTTRWLALSIVKSDRLRVDCADPRLQTRAVTALRSVTERTGFFLSGDWTCDAYEFRLRDKPWNSHGDTGWVRPRMLLLGILEALDKEGWRSYIAIAQSTVVDDYNKPDSWYFVMDREPPGEVPPPSEPVPVVEAPLALARTESRPWGSRNPYAQASFGT